MRRISKSVRDKIAMANLLYPYGGVKSSAGIDNKGRTRFINAFRMNFIEKMAYLGAEKHSLLCFVEKDRGVNCLSFLDHDPGDKKHNEGHDVRVYKKYDRITIPLETGLRREKIVWVGMGPYFRIYREKDWIKINQKPC
jgi:hypothetical protein